MGWSSSDRRPPLRARAHSTTVTSPQTTVTEAAGARSPADPGSDDDLARVFTAIAADDERPVTSIVHAWGATADDPVDDLDALDRALDRGVHSMLACARASGSLRRGGPLRIDVVTSGAFAVDGTEELRPERAALLGPVRVVPLEYSGVTTRLVDLGAPIDPAADLANLVDELTTVPPADAGSTVVARRGALRWGPTVAVRPTSDATGPPPFRRGGNYLIVGGLGGVGLSIARSLAERYGASLTLTGRQGRPVPAGDDDREALRRLELLDEIEARAERLDVVAVDAADERAMTDLVADLHRDGRRLDGVLVAAGVADREGAIHRRSREAMTRSIAAKAHGTLVLERALAGRDLDFVVLSSSIAATLFHNRFAQVGYVTANAYVEAHALRGRDRGLPMTTVAWDDWLEIGMSVRAARDFADEFQTEVDLVDRHNSFSPAEGVALLDRVLAVDEPVVLVSPTDLERRIAADVDVVSPFLEQAIGDGGDGVADGAEATTTELVSGLWSGLLGFESFEADADFFELGGDSLQAARMADRLSRALGIDVPVDVVLDTPVLRDLVVAIDGLRADDTPGADNDRVSVSTGPAPLGSAQQRFLDRRTERPEHFNISVLLRPTNAVRADDLRVSLERLIARHDALRLSVVALEADPATTAGEPLGYLQMVAEPSEAGDPLSIVDLADLTGDAVTTEIAERADRLQRSFDLAKGPLVKAELYLLPAGDQRLLLAMHHLVGDRVSLLLMLDALDADLRALAAGVDLPTTSQAVSFLDWVDAQIAAVATDEEASVDRWCRRPWDRVVTLPVDRSAVGGENRNDAASAVVIRTPVGPDGRGDGAATEGDDARGNDARLDEHILDALAAAVAEWSGSDVAYVDVLGHGRRLPVAVDVSRSVGMFITYSPVLVDVRADDAERLGDLRSDLDRGWSFDVLRHHGTQATQERLAPLPRAEVLYNFVGRPVASDPSALLVTVDEPKGVETDPSGRRDHLLAVRAEVVGDREVELVFVFSTRHHERSTIEAVAERTRELLTARR